MASNSRQRESTLGDVSMAWTFADVWEAVVAAQPDRAALVQGDRVITWSEFDRRADALAAHMIAAGLGRQAKVACYLYNGPEYLESYFAAFKGGFAPANTNYRYGPEEVMYLFDNADAEAIVFHAGFTDIIEKVRPRLPRVKTWIAVAEPGHPVPAFAADYDAIVAKTPAQRPVKAPWGRSGEDLLLLYTGGTTGMPSRKFDAVELWNEVARLQARNIVIVGLAFSTPMLEALDANPGRWDLSSIRAMSSSGSMWSYENKRGLLSHIPQAMIADSFGSSEAVGLGASASAAGAEAQTAAFMLGPNTGVFTEDGRRVTPGSGERGLVAVTGFLPLGYYKDEEKTAKTFKVIEGVRWSVPGDWAEVNTDGTLKLLGRGSVCINTGGEKVFPEEVEEALKTHASVRDAVVVGLPDARFGERICAVVEPVPGEAPSLAELSGHVRDHLAGYKAPRDLVLVDSIGRAPNGKVDYAAAKARALAELKAPA